MGGEPRPFPHLADGFRFPRLGEKIELQSFVNDVATVPSNEMVVVQLTNVANGPICYQTNLL